MHLSTFDFRFIYVQLSSIDLDPLVYGFLIIETRLVILYFLFCDKLKRSLQEGPQQHTTDTVMLEHIKRTRI